MVFLSICTALYDYAPQGDNELLLQEGEIVFILEKSSEDDWWKAKKRAPSEEEEEPVGLIPNNYVEEAQPTHHARAMYDYNRQTDEELSFTEEAILSVYDTEDPEWTLVGKDGEYGFVPANYIEITGKAEQTSPEPVLIPQSPVREPELESEPDSPPPLAAPTQPRHGPAATIAGIMHKKSPSSDPPPANLSQPPRRPQLTPDASDEEVPAPSLPRRPPSEQLSPPPTQYASPRSPDSPGIAASPPHNRVVSQKHDEDRPQPSLGGFHLYNITEVVSAMGKNKKLPTTLGLNTATGTIMIAPEKSRDGPQMEWTAEKLTHYSIEGKHVFIELIRPSKSVDFHAGAKDTAHEIVASLGEIAGASRAEGLREIIDAGTGGGLRKAKILYDFMAQGDDEVTVAVDDEVAVLDDTKSEEWWMVRRLKNGREGVVPSSYVEITGVMPPPRTSSGINAGKSVVEQNRLEEERLAKEAVKSSKEKDVKGPSEVGPGLKLPTRGSSKARGDNSNSSSQRNHKKNKHSKSDSSSKSKPDMAKTRTWTDRSGTFKVEAQFIGLKDGKIHLHKLNGVKIAVPVVKMAAEDLEYVEKATGISLDDDKPLSEIRRKNTQKDGDRKKSQAAASKPGATVEQPKSAPPKSEGPEYDWFDFFLKAGVSPYQCERYASNFNKDSMDENILGDITPTVLRTLGLKEGDILRVMKYLDVKFGRTDTNATDDANGGLFSGPGGTLRNNTRKGRPAPPVESNDVVDASKLGQKGQTDNKQSDRTETPLSKVPNPPNKDNRGFDDDAWDVKPSKQAAPEPVSKPAPAPPPAATAPPQQPTITGSLLDLSLLSEPLQPEKVQPKPTPAIQPQQAQVQPPPQTPQQQQPQMQQQPIQQQPTGANPTFFSQIGQQPTGQQFPQQNTPLPQTQQAFGNQQNYQNPQQPQQINPSRQRPQAPPQTQSTQQGTLMPPPPSRPLSAPQTQPQNSNFGPPPLQPQLTGYQPHSQLQNQISQPGQSLNDLSQQRFQQQQFNQQQPGQQQFGQQQLQPQQTGFGQQPQQIQPQQTGFGQQPQGYNQFNNGIIPQPTGFGQSFNQLPQQQSGLQSMQNPYISGQQAGSPFADPRIQQQQPGGFQPLQPQSTGFQPQFQQPQQTGINSMLPPALQPQPTGVNGFPRPGFGQPPQPIPPMPPMPQEQPAAAPLIPQKTGPAPPVRFGTPAAPKLVPQRTGRANLAAATPSNPFGF